LWLKSFYGHEGSFICGIEEKTDGENRVNYIAAGLQDAQAPRNGLLLLHFPVTAVAVFVFIPARFSSVKFSSWATAEPSSLIKFSVIIRIVAMAAHLRMVLIFSNSPGRVETLYRIIDPQ
jgi:hypothetical protein